VVGTRRSEIFDIACDLFADRGFAATSTRDIAQAAGIQVASLYSHVSSKAELLTEVLVPFLDSLASAQAQALAGPGPGVARLRSMIERVMDLCATHAAEMSILHYNWPQIRTTEELAPLVHGAARALENWKAAIEGGRKDGSLRRDVDPDTVARLVTGALQGLVDSYRYTSAGDLVRKRGVAALATDLINVLVDGMAPQGANRGTA
jgi:TetR/AcrR family transcriptional regulator, cholesterol catabolism regulator